MDMETGEILIDKETGEMPARAKVNTETGECEINHQAPYNLKTNKKFKIPQNMGYSHKMIKSVKAKTKHRNLSKTNDFFPCILFLIPTLLFFNPMIAACLTFTELCLHIWAHKKNKRIGNKEVYYKSPLHIIVCEFCAACRDEFSASKITSIQDKRNYKFVKYGINYVHGIVM